MGLGTPAFPPQVERYFAAWMRGWDWRCGCGAGTPQAFDRASPASGGSTGCLPLRQSRTYSPIVVKLTPGRPAMYRTNRRGTGSGVRARSPAGAWSPSGVLADLVVEIVEFPLPNLFDGGGWRVALQDTA